MLEALAMFSLATAWLVPNHYSPWNSFYSETASGIGLLLLIASLFRRQLDDRFALSSRVLLLVAVIPWLQLQFGLLHFAADAAIPSLYLIAFSSAITAGSWWSNGNRQKHASMLAWTMLLPSIVSAFIALCQGLQVNAMGIWTLDAVPGMRPYANLAQPNNLATLLGFGTAGLVLLVEQRRIGKTAAAALLILLLIGLAVTQSRTALLYGPLIFVVVALGRARGLVKNVRLASLGLLSALHWLATWYWPLIQKSLMLTTQTSLAERTTDSVRFLVWPILVGAVSQSPWHGYGWLQVGEAELSAADRYPVAGELWMHGHNLFLELVVWCGYPLGVILCLAIVWWAVTRLKAVQDSEGIVAACIVGIFLIHAMVELPHHYAYFLIPVGLWMGFLERTGSPRAERFRLFRVLPVGVCLLGGLMIWKDYPAIEEDFRNVRFEALRVGRLVEDKPVVENPMLSTLTAFLKYARIVPAAGMSAMELDAMEVVMKRFPYAGSIYRYALALALNDRVQEVLPLFDKLRHIHGDAAYLTYRRLLHERAAAGDGAIAAADALLAAR